MAGTRTKPAFERQLIGLAVAACFAGIVHANPTGPAVAHGAASFATSGKTLTVTNTPGAIINWQAFSIRPDEVTRFIQSGAASAVLNRVTGPGQSALLGQLLSNGRVFLINPNGVVVGAGARIDTAGFVASSLHLSNEDFLAGRFRFTDPGNAGKVTNAGSINAHSGGQVYLIAPTVENHGVITAPNGDITLAAGKSVELVSAGNPHLRVQVEAGGAAVNVGQLIAESGRVGLYGAAIRNAGTISADSASVNAAGNVVLKASRDVTLESTSVVSASGAKGGSVEIQAEQGTLLAEGRIAATGAVEKGGEVKLLGTQVGLVGTAAVDASGATGGGTVLVGGDYQGGNPQIQNAQASFVGPDAAIRADATQAGDGGKIVVWADGATRFSGAASARGGAAGGDGGFVEVSGKDWLAFTGRVDTTAPVGQTGMLLLDPTDITISAAATSNGTCPPAGPCFALVGAPAAANLNVIDLQNALANTNVTVNTASAGAGNGDINVATGITYATGFARTLNLTATRDVNVNAAINATNNNGPLTVNVTAGRNYTQAAAAAITTRRGNVTISATGGTATLGSINTNTGTAASAGTLAVNANGAIAQQAGTTLDVRGQATFGAGAANNITLANATNNLRSNVRITSGNNVSIRDNSALAFGGGASTISGALTADSNGNVTQAAGSALAVNGGAAFNTRGANRDVTLNQANNVSGAVTMAAATGSIRDVNWRNTNAAAQTPTTPATHRNLTIVHNNAAVTLPAKTLTGNLNVTAGGAITDTDNLAVTGTTTLTAGAANSITLDNANNFGGNVRILSGNNVTLNDVNALTFGGGASVVSGNLVLTAGGAITQASALTVNGTTSVNAGIANDVTLANAGNNFVGAVSVTGNDVSLRDANALVLGTVTATTNGGDTGSLTLQAGGSVTQAGIATTPTLTATLTGAASQLNLGTQPNAIAALGAVTAPGGVALTNGNVALAVNGNVTATNNPVSISTGTAGYTQGNFDVSAGTGVISITADSVAIAANTGNNAFATSGTLTLKPASAGQAMSLAGASGFDLAQAELTAFSTGATGPIVIGDGAAATGTMTIGGTANLAGKTLTLNAGSITDGANPARTITATNLNLNARTGAIGSAAANGAIDVAATNLTVNTVNQNAYVNATGAVNLGAGASSLGAGGLDLAASGAITQSGAVTATGSSTFAAGAASNVTLTNAANDFGTVAVTSGNTVSIVDQNALALGASSVGTLQAQTLSGNLTLGGVVAASGAGNSIVLAPAGSLVNGAGPAALVVPVGGRWLVYLAAPANVDAVNGPASGNQAVWGTAFPAAVAAGGNRYVFATSPTLTFTSTEAAKVYGDVANVSGNYTVGGYVNAATYGNVFTQDTAANAFTGAPSVTSAGTPAAANVGTYPITVAAGTLAATTGYLLAFNSAGQLTVSARPITVTPGPLARPYGDPNPVTTTTLTVGGSGLVNGNTITQVDVTSPATATDPAGGAYALNASNAVFGGGGLASNYAITYAPGILTIGQRPITVQASNQARPYGDLNPATGPFTITAGSLAGADAIGSVNVTSPAVATSPAGSVWVLTNTGTNFTSGAATNYAITLQDGQLTITPRTITLTAGSAARVYGDPNPVPAPLYTVGGSGMANAENAQTLFGFTVASGALGTTPVGAYAAGPNAYNVAGVGVGVNGNYNVTAINSGTLTINPAPLTITANNAARPEAQPNPPFSATYAGFKNAETPAALGGALAFTTPATIASPPGGYAITPFGQTATNYAITYVDGVLTVTPLPAPPPSPTGGVAAANNALITATQRSADAEGEVAPRLPDAKRVDCLELERAGVRGILTRCF